MLEYIFGGSIECFIGMLWTITEWISGKRAGSHNPNFLAKGQIRGIDTKITFEVEKKKVHTFEEVRFSNKSQITFAARWFPSAP